MMPSGRLRSTRPSRGWPRVWRGATAWMWRSARRLRWGVGLDVEQEKGPREGRAASMFRDRPPTTVIQSATMRAGISDNLHGDGHLTSIGARFEHRKCPDLPGETAAKLPHASVKGSLEPAFERR